MLYLLLRPASAAEAEEVVVEQACCRSRLSLKCGCELWGGRSLRVVLDDQCFPNSRVLVEIFLQEG